MQNGHVMCCIYFCFYVDACASLLWNELISHLLTNLSCRSCVKSFTRPRWVQGPHISSGIHMFGHVFVFINVLIIVFLLLFLLSFSWFIILCFSRPRWVQGPHISRAFAYSHKLSDTAYTVYTVEAVDMVDTVDMVYTADMTQMRNPFIHICLVPMFQWERLAEGWNALWKVTVTRLSRSIF